MNGILVSEPIYGGLPPSVYANRIAFWRHNFAAKEYRVASLVLGPRRAIRSARDIACNATLSSNLTHVLFLDDDVKTPPDIVESLLSVDRPIVGGLMRRDDGAPIVFKELSPPHADLRYEPWVDHPKDRAFQCPAVGAGCMLVRVEVLAALRQSSVWMFNYDESVHSMDIIFCERARAAGFEVWCWPIEPCEQIPHYS